MAEDGLVYVGMGEDRNQQDARTKAEAIALQDLANDCSLIPQRTRVQEEHYDETVGILYRSFAKVTVALQDCQDAKAAQNLAQILNVAHPVLTAQLSLYQKTYDAPEPAEAAPLLGSSVVSDSTHLFIVRQQLALTKQVIILSHSGPSGSQGISSATQAIAGFEVAHPEIWKGTQAFSTSRPNAIDHQAAAVRDTIAERARIQKDYPATPPPVVLPKNDNSKRGGKGSRHRGQSQPQPESSDGSSQGI